LSAILYLFQDAQQLWHDKICHLSHDSVLAEGSRSRVADRSSSADLECRTTDVKNVDVDTESLASLESMEVDVDINEGIKDEDLKVEALGEPHDVSPINDHLLCIDVIHGRIVVPTLKGGLPYASFCTEFCLRAERYLCPIEDKYATQSCRLIDWSVLTKGTLHYRLVEAMASRSLALTGCQPEGLMWFVVQTLDISFF
jgi:hypothetical protein